MKIYKLFANVHPLEPNLMFCVDTTSSLGTTNDSEKWKWIKDRQKALNKLGYKTEIQEVITTIYK